MWETTQPRASAALAEWEEQCQDGGTEGRSSHQGCETASDSAALGPPCVSLQPAVAAQSPPKGSWVEDPYPAGAGHVHGLGQALRVALDALRILHELSGLPEKGEGRCSHWPLQIQSHASGHRQAVGIRECRWPLLEIQNHFRQRSQS